IVSKPTTGPEVDGDIDIAIVYSEPRVTDAIHDLLWMGRSKILCSPKLLEGIDASDPARLITASDLPPLKIDGRQRHFFWEMFVRSIVFFQAEDGIRHLYVTRVQTCALPI